MSQEITLRVKFVSDDLSEQDKKVLLPKQKSTLASGFDVASAVRHTVTLEPQGRILIPTGIAVALPPGYEAQIRSRSGLALKHGIMVLNSPGTIDADYRGEIKVILANFSDHALEIDFGMRIAQMVIARVEHAHVQIASELESSDRDDAGFGSTGLYA